MGAVRKTQQLHLRLSRLRLGQYRLHLGPWGQLKPPWQISAFSDRKAGFVAITADTARPHISRIVAVSEKIIAGELRAARSNQQQAFGLRRDFGGF